MFSPLPGLAYTGAVIPVSVHEAPVRPRITQLRTRERPLSALLPHPTQDSKCWIMTPCTEAASPSTNTADKTRTSPPPSSPGASPSPRPAPHAVEFDLVVVAGPFSTKWGRCRRRRRMGCGNQDRDDEGSRRRLCNRAGVEAAARTPSGASRHLPQQAGEGIRAELEEYFLGAIAALMSRDAAGRARRCGLCGS